MHYKRGGSFRNVTDRNARMHLLIGMSGRSRARKIISMGSPGVHMLARAVEGGFIPRLVYVIQVQHVYHVSCKRGQSDRRVDGIGKPRAESFPLVQLILSN
jgi:hypothetical protein